MMNYVKWNGFRIRKSAMKALNIKELFLPSMKYTSQEEQARDQYFAMVMVGIGLTVAVPVMVFIILGVF